MKLHTDFHDYYDNAVGYGIDEKVHYNRFTKEVEINIKTKADFPPSYLEAYLLGFCGNIYPVTILRRFSKSIYSWENDFEDNPTVEIFYAYSFEEGEEKYLEWNKFSSGFGYSNNREYLKVRQFFMDWSFQSDEIFLKHQVPVWLVKLETNREKGLINPKLKDYGFNRIKDSFTAFQEISMYLSNILVEQKEVVKIEDKYRIEQHGFDLKTSFRKEKMNRKT
jgi:hypothetical protein